MRMTQALESLGLYDGVVVSGGEPPLHRELSNLLLLVKQRDLKVRLDINGSFPDELRKLLDLGLVDEVAMDYKVPLDMYGLAGWDRPELIARSVALLAERQCGYLRTTVVPGLHTDEVLDAIRAELESLAGGRLSWILQPYQEPPPRTLLAKPAA